MAVEKTPVLLNDFLYTWRIENLHLCWQKGGEELRSPIFKIAWLTDSPLSLCLYPRGINCDESWISYFFVREDKGPATYKGTKISLYLLDADGSRVDTENYDGFLSLRKAGKLGFSHFVSWITLLQAQTKYFPDDILTLCCRIWREGELDMKGNKKCTEVKYFARTRIHKKAISKHIVIHNYILNEQKVGEISLIQLHDPVIIFSAFFGEMHGHKSLTIVFDVNMNDKMKCCFLKFSLLDQKKKRIFWKNMYVCLKSAEFEIEISSYFHQNSENYTSKEMFDEKYLFLACQFIFTDGSIMQKREKEDYGTNLNNLITETLPFSTSLQTKRCLTLSDALKNMHLDVESHDTRIKTGSATVTAHEMILSRSNTFEWIEKVEDESTSLKTIELYDDVDIVKRVVYFLYTNVVQNLNWEAAMKLYSASVKYNIGLLKDKCCFFIFCKMHITNAVEIILLADAHDDKELTNMVKSFLVQTDANAFNSKEWNSFEKSHKDLAREIKKFVSQSKQLIYERLELEG